MQLDLTLVDRRGETPLSVPVDNLVIAGWTGRDRAAVEAHIAELEKLGVPRPGKIPTYYRCAASLLTTAGRIEVAGDASSGEVEFVLLAAAGELLVGVGSDHTDRALEKTGVTLSKQVCAKPVGREVWKFSDIAGHWDALELRSFAAVDGARERYQEGPVTAMRAPADLLAGYGATELPDGTAMFCGTLPVKGEIRPAARFEMELSDPVLGRQLRHQYEVTELPVEG